MHRGGEVGRQRGEERREREKGSVSLLWHRHKGIPSARLSPPTCLLSPRLAPRHTRVHTHSCLHGQSRNGLTRKKGQRVGDAETLRERREMGWGLWRSTFRVWHWRAWRTRGRGKWVKTVVSGRYSSGFASSQDMIITFMTLWSMNTVYLPLTFFFFLNLWSSTEGQFSSSCNLLIRTGRSHRVGVKVCLLFKCTVLLALEYCPVMRSATVDRLHYKGQMNTVPLNGMVSFLAA